MKAYLIIFLVVMACTCWLTDQGGPPSPFPIGVKGATEAKFGMSRNADQMIQNFGYTSDSRDIGIITNINSKGNSAGADLPWGAAN